MKIRLNEDTTGPDAAAVPRRASALKWKIAGALVIVVATWIAVRGFLHPPPPTGAVAFEGADILLVPGPGWNQIRTGGYTRVRNICLPVLEGLAQFKGSMIEVLASSNFPKEPDEMAANLVQGLQNEASVVKGSVQQEKFVAASGLMGIHLWCRIAVTDLDRKGETAAHCYIVKNAKGRCVRINLTTSLNSETEFVDRMIRQTLASY